MCDTQALLERWGSWTASDSSGMDYFPIVVGFKGLLPQAGRSRSSCTGSDALIIEGCLARSKSREPYEHLLLVAYYLYGISERKIAKVRKKGEKLIRIEIQMVERSINGCLATLDI